MLRKYNKPSLFVLASLAVATLAGCASRPQPLYYWGNFQDQQYAHFKGDRGPEEGIQNLEQVREDAKSNGKRVPPGLHAHLGMLYGLTGRTDLFEQNLLSERQQFPESSIYVDFLLKNKQKQ